ncbi:MAG: GreA/GreB family elongation factor [Solirubrobacteraceae bacterium]
MAAAQIAPPAADGTAGIGSHVRVRDLHTGDVDEYELVGAIEPDVGNGRVSVGAPVGRALVGSVNGAVVEVEAPRGTLQFEILGIRPIHARAAGEGSSMKTAAAATGLRVAVLQHEPETGLGAFARLLGDTGVRYELVETTSGASLPDAAAFDGAIALGGSLDVYDLGLLETRRWIRNAVLRDLPFLGVCLGGQLLASALGGLVTRAPRPEVGIHDLFLTEAAARDPLFGSLPGRLAVLGWHEDVFSLPRGAVPLAGSIAFEHQAFRWGASAYGLQFHPEVRADDLARWVSVPGYRGLVERAGGDWDVVAAALERTTAELDALAKHLLERWLFLVAGVAATGERLLCLSA